MSGRSILAALLAAIVLFIWGFLFWTVLPWSMETIRPVPNHAAVSAAVADIPPGTYHYPDISHTGVATNDTGAQTAWNDMYKRGPVFELRMSRAGDMMSPWMFIWGFVHFFASTLIAAILLATVARGLAGYGARVFFLTMVGILIAVFADLAGPIWFWYPWDRAIADAVYTVIGWLLAGLVMGAMIKPREA